MGQKEILNFPQRAEVMSGFGYIPPREILAAVEVKLSAENK